MCLTGKNVVGRHDRLAHLEEHLRIIFEMHETENILQMKFERDHIQYQSDIPHTSGRFTDLNSFLMRSNIPPVERKSSKVIVFFDS